MIRQSFTLTVVALTSLCVLRVVHLIDLITLRDAETPEYIRLFGYPVEVHDIVTEDGYILEVHRIPGHCFIDESLPPVLLAHGLFGCSSDFVLTGPPQSLAFMLADLGYDVWLVNYRGNTYGLRNVHLTTEDYAFWNFSWHEMGYYDNTAFIDHILRETGHKQVLYVGHSLGTTTMFVTCITRPEYNDKIQFAVALGPIAYLAETNSPARAFAPNIEEFAAVITLLTKGQFLSRKNIVFQVVEQICTLRVNEVACASILFDTMGYDPVGFNYSLSPIIFGHNPAGSSIKTVQHYAQQINTGAFQFYDYGPLKNLEYYHSIFPPAYNISLITTPTALFFGDNDLFADPLDVLHLYAELTSEKHLINVNLTTFNHVDFIWCKDIKGLVYDKIVDLFNISINSQIKTGCQRPKLQLPTWGVV